MMRIITLLVLAFWGVMTTLLVRSLYFADGFNQVPVPTRLVLKGFLEGGATLNTLHIYHREKKLGHASINVRKLKDAKGLDSYRLHMTGLLEKGALEAVEGQVSWRMELDLEDVEHWAGSKGQVRFAGASTVLDFDWARDQRMPAFTLKQKGVVLADDALVGPLVAQMMGGGLAAGGMPLAEGLGLPIPPEGAAGHDFMQVKAREGMMDLAGQKRRAYVLELTAMEHWKARAYFTEAGELALVDLPEGYRLVEPVIYGLVPDYDEEAEAEAAAEAAAAAGGAGGSGGATKATGAAVPEPTGTTL